MDSWNTPAVPVLADPQPGRLKAYDTSARRVRTIGPGPGEVATMYVCGITPYDATHLGHAFTYLTFDLVNRVWRDLGATVRYVQNVTDVDDPLLERARATGVGWADLAAAEVERFRCDMAALRVLAPDSYPAVSESIPAIEECVQRLRSAGRAYQADDGCPDWYFAFDQGLGYGPESHLSRPEMLELFAERGGDPDRTGKRGPLDPLLWRQARDGEPAWDSGLGRGRPGWHVECVALACGGVGETIDLQGGGADLVFPHHEYCAALARAITGRPFARAYVHAAMVGVDGRKMSKSDGNLVKVADLTGAGADPMAVRLALLAHHYRADWSWVPADLGLAVQRLADWRQARHGLTSVDFAPYTVRIRECLRQDLRADQALDVVDEWALASIDAAEDHPLARGEMAAVVDALLGVALA